MSASLFGKVLLVVDSADTSLAAAEYAVKLAQSCGGAIDALYVVDTPTVDYLTRLHVLVADEAEEYQRDMHTTAERYLSYLRELAKAKGVRLQTRVQTGAIHQVVLQVARELPADAIVIGSWRCSATQKDAAAAGRQLILEDAACPVIVVHG